MQRHGAQAQDVLAGETTTPLRAVLAEMRLRARWHLRAASNAIADMPPAIVPAFLPLAPVGALLARMERPHYDPFAPPDVPQWRRQWLMWRAARRPSRIAS
jgi:phytoene synthase